MRRALVIAEVDGDHIVALEMLDVSLAVVSHDETFIGALSTPLRADDDRCSGGIDEMDDRRIDRAIDAEVEPDAAARRRCHHLFGRARLGIDRQTGWVDADLIALVGAQIGDDELAPRVGLAD